jgi:ATP-dependent exoDNAse (exonuclease V) alpha subunit
VSATIRAGDGVSVIEALAGTGKTFTAGVLGSVCSRAGHDVLGSVYSRAGHDVLGVAPTARAARELSEQAGMSSRTLDRLLLDIEQFGDELPRGCVVILDAAGMAPTRSSARLLELAARAQATVIAIGDPGQLASVQAGGWLRAVGRDIGAQRLTQVMRQRDPRERRALEALHEREPHRFLDERRERDGSRPSIVPRRQESGRWGSGCKPSARSARPRL